MPGGYVLQKRRTVPDNFGTRSGKIPSGIIPAQGARFGGAVLDFGSTNFGTLQETYSFRTGRDQEQLDLTSGGEILRYFLMHGIPTDFDTGHDFWTTKSWTTYSHREAFVSSYSGQSWARGTLSAGAPPIPTISPLNVNFYGNRAISRVAPTSPNANLAQTTAEIIREKGIALPGTSLFLWLESRALFYRSLGKEYLNITFGWKPFLSELYSIVQQMLSITEEIRKYSAISETSVRRRYDFEPISSIESTTTNFSGGYLNMGNGSNIDSWSELYSNRAGQLIKSVSSLEKIYFVGRFMFRINPGKGLLDKLEAFEQIANKLLGTRITPSVLWELTPWSWLIDWFVDVQSAMQVAGLQYSDKFLMQYGYLMRRTVKSESYTITGPSFANGPDGPFSSETFIVKSERVKGTPFGFGINPESIDPGQWAILAALAISKGPRRLPKLPQGEPTD